MDKRYRDVAALFKYLPDQVPLVLFRLHREMAGIFTRNNQKKTKLKIGKKSSCEDRGNKRLKKQERNTDTKCLYVCVCVPLCVYVCL